MSGRDMGLKQRRGGGEAPSGQHSWLSEVENPRPPTTFVFRAPPPTWLTSPPPHRGGVGELKQKNGWGGYVWHGMGKQLIRW
jgi:hypothetical protein